MFIWVPVTPLSEILTPDAPTESVDPSKSHETVAVDDPSYVKSAIPFPSVKSGRTVVPTNVPVNEPLNEPVKLFVFITPKESAIASVSIPPSFTLIVLAADPL